MSTAFFHPDRAAGVEASTSHHTGEDSARGRGGRGRGGPRGRGRGATGVAQGFPGSIPTGFISKLKSQLRQTKRLLTRDDLTPDVRITTERRLKTLEVELEKATEDTVSRELEQKMASRYRGIRFFERQKVLRKIKQTKKGLLASPDDPTLVQTLFDSRIDLYYILKYPKTEKYIALFPEGTYVPHLPLPNSSTGAATTRATMREVLRKRMERGELEMEAEGGDLGIEGEEDVGSGPAGEGGSAKRGLEEKEVEVERPAKKVKMVASVEVKEVPVVEEEMVEEVKEAAIEEKEVRGVRQSKKDKKDLKDQKRKAKKGDTAPAPVVEAAPITVEEPTPMDVEESAPPGETDEARGVRLSKKAKKDLKDKKRKEKKDAEAAAKAGNVPAKSAPPKAGANGKEAPVMAKADHWVEQDDFFA